jgi:hypothetical protein
MKGIFQDLIWISGGQTGVDRAALDFALENHIPCGGFCPLGRRAEDGIIPHHYPLTELPTANYDARTRMNAEQADGTLIISTFPLTGGTLYTQACVQRAGKPLLILHPETEAPGNLLWEWLQAHNVHILNIAGPRESTDPGIYDKTYRLLQSLAQIPSPQPRQTQ